MDITKLHPCLTYGISHSKEYKPSIVGQILSDVDEDGNLIKHHSDAYFLLRQNKLQQTIGAETVRAYIDQLRATQGSNAIDTANLSDDDLFGLIEPKEINNLTTAYEFSKYLASRSEQVKSKYNELCEKKKNYGDFCKRYNLSFTDDSTSKTS